MLYIYCLLTGISPIQTQWKDELGKRWILGKGLIESSIEQNVLKSDMSLNEYKQFVRASGLWMSFNQDLSFTDEKFKKLDSLCSSGINNPRGRQFCPLALLNLLYLIIVGGSCSYWAGSHYKMLDGTILSLPAGCGHTLVSEPRDNTMKISTR